MGGTATAEAEQAQLLNTDTKEITPDWIDPLSPLKVPVNPLHYAAHKYQLILDRLDKQATRNPAQFNSGNYIAIMEKLEKLWQAINEGKTVNDLDEGKLAPSGRPGNPPANGNLKPISMGSGVPTDDPATR